LAFISRQGRRRSGETKGRRERRKERKGKGKKRKGKEKGRRRERKERRRTGRQGEQQCFCDLSIQNRYTVRAPGIPVPPVTPQGLTPEALQPTSPATD
jgi:hypothetical protein